MQCVLIQLEKFIGAHQAFLSSIDAHICVPVSYGSHVTADEAAYWC